MRSARPSSAPGSQIDDEVDEERLAARVAVDPDAFTDVYDRYHRVVYGYVAGRLGVELAEDLAAETFMVAFGHRHRFDPERGGLRPWLLGIATNLVARHRRKEARRYRAIARSDPPPDVGSHEDRVVAELAARRIRPRLLEALAALSAGERDVLLLVALSQLSHAETANALGIREGTVGSRLSRARKRLRDAIGARDEDIPDTGGSHG
jgi:RNA polymerase sigma factor (sigma-70 family)